MTQQIAAEVEAIRRHLDSSMPTWRRMDHRIVDALERIEQLAAGLREAAEGQTRGWGIQMAWKHGPMTLNCSDRATAEDYLTTLTPEQLEIATLVSRLVGPWEPTPVRCCDLHGRNCEQGGDECCERCTEAHHFTPGHGGVPCSAPDLSGNGGAK